MQARRPLPEHAPGAVSTSHHLSAPHNCATSSSLHVCKALLVLISALLALATGEWKGRDRNKTDTPPVRPNPNLQLLSAELVDFFARRGISQATLETAGVMQERLYAPPLREMADTIAFTYRRKGQLINIKYRTVDKKFWQASGASFLG